MLYHGVRRTAAGALYRVGLALLNLEHPERCLQRGEPWVFGPEAPYELHGDVGNVVFPCGTTLGDDGDTLHVYYGAADTSIGVATASLRACSPGSRPTAPRIRNPTRRLRPEATHGPGAGSMSNNRIAPGIGPSEGLARGPPRSC